MWGDAEWILFLQCAKEEKVEECKKKLPYSDVKVST